MKKTKQKKTQAHHTQFSLSLLAEIVGELAQLLQIIVVDGRLGARQRVPHVGHRDGRLEQLVAGHFHPGHFEGAGIARRTRRHQIVDDLGFVQRRGTADGLWGWREIEKA